MEDSWIFPAESSIRRFGFATKCRERYSASRSVRGFEIGQGFRVGTENAFAMILPPGRYELFSYVVENVGEFAHLSSAPAGPCEEVSVVQMDSNQFKVSRQYFWVDEKIDLKSLPDPMTEENAKRFRRSVITVPERSLVYIGDWVLRRISPLVSSNKDETDKVIAKRFPNLPTAEAITQLPEAEKDE